MNGAIVGERREGDATESGKEEKLPGPHNNAHDELLPSGPPSLSSAMSTSFSSPSSSSSSSSMPRLSEGSSSGSMYSDTDVVLESSQESESADAPTASAATTSVSVLGGCDTTLEDNDTLMSECLMLQADEDLQTQTQSLMFDMHSTTSSLSAQSKPSTANGAMTSSSSASSSAANGNLTRAMSLVEEVELDEVELAAIDQIFNNLSTPNISTTTTVTTTTNATATTNPPPATTPDIESLLSLFPNPALPLSFRPRSILAATDLSSQLWCEHQLHLTLLHGKRTSPAQQAAMDAGTARHDQLEREMHDVVEVQVRGREEEWGLRMVNGVVGLHELMLVGKTRELMVMGRVVRRVGERVVWIMGVIDEVERVDNAVILQRWQQEEDKEKQQRTKQEENRQKRRQREEEERQAQLDEQRREEQRRRKESIRNHFPAFKWEKGAVIELDGGGGVGAGGWKDRKEGKDDDDDEMEMLMRQYEELQAEVEKKRQEEQLAMEEKGRQEKAARELERQAKLLEQQKQEKRKNRARILLQQSSSSFVLSDNKTRAKQTLPSVAQQRTTRMQLSVYKYMFDTLATRKPNAAASSAYTTTVTAEVQLPSCLWTAKELLADMQLDGSKTFTGVMLTHLLQSGFPAHTTLQSLINLYLHTFSSLTHPSSPFLSIHYEHQHTSTPLGSSSFPFAPLDFAVDLDWQLAYWLGLRASEGIGEGVVEEWKCRSCEFVVECDRTRWAGRAAKVAERKERDEEERRERERRKKREEEEKAKAKEEEIRRKQKEAEDERKSRMDERRHVAVKVEDDSQDALADEAKDTVSTTIETVEQAKTRRARKRRSLEEMTLTQEDELEKARKEKKLQDIILID